MVLQNTVLAENWASLGPDCYEGHPAYTIGSAGYNLIGDIFGCVISLTTGDLTNVDPKLGQWEGSPGYHPLLSDSPAINAGNPAGCMGSTGLLTTDQRGAPRVGRCDIGAYEAGLTATKQATGTYAPGESLTYVISLRSDANSDIAGAFVTDVLPDSLSYVPGSFSASTGTGGESGGVITWTGTVPAVGSVTISFRATIRADLPSCSVITNKATVGGPGYQFERQVTGAIPCACNLTKQPGNPVLSAGAAGSWDEAAVWGPAVLKVGSSYKLWYTGDDGSNPSRIGLATSNDGTTWTKEAANPVLSPSQTWEAKGISAASIISDSGIYKMWYTGRDSDGVSRIGYATSTDGVSWTPYGSNPILDVGPAGGWEDDDVMRPAVFKEGSTYQLWYAGNDGVTQRIGHATSSDGIHWIKDPANPVLDVGTPGAWDWLNVYGPSVVKVGAEYQLWYSGETLPAAWQTGYAMSSDGSTWTRGKMLIPEGSSGAFDANSADYPSVMVDGDKFKVWYSGLNNSGNYTIGYATAEICSTASVPPNHPVYLPLVVKSTGNSCPAYYTDNFSDPTSGWPVDDDSNRRYAYTDGQYQIWVKNPAAGWWATPGAKATDFTASVSARRTSGVSGAYGIRFGISEDSPDLSYYEFIVEDAYYSVWRYDSGGWTALRDWTASSHIRTGTDWNRLKVIRNGASISVYVNNQLLTTVSDSYLAGLRRIGLVAYSPDDSGLDARFDDFSLYPASCGAGAASATGIGFEMGEPGGYEAPVPPGLGQMRQSLPQLRCIYG